jgi:4-hydroxybenzoate polyprenyltransferase
MKALIRAIVNFYIYSSLHISLAASLFVLEVFVLLRIDIDWNYILLVFSATMFIYSIHRVIGLKKVEDKSSSGRYKIIKTFKSHIIFYACISLVGIACIGVLLPIEYYYFLIPLGVISLLYTLPVFGQGRRLRDIGYLKIFLIAFVWAYIALGHNLNDHMLDRKLIVYLILLERFLYILAVTLPFDIRDIEIDQKISVNTIPSYLGIHRTYVLVNTLLLICYVLSLAVCNFLNILTVTTAILMGLSLLSTYTLIVISKGKDSDYYYSGLIDGAILLKSIIVIIGLKALDLL